MRSGAVLTAVFALALGSCGESGRPDDDLSHVRPPEQIRVASAAEAVAALHLPSLDPATMTSAEIARVLGPGEPCVFRYTSGGNPVLGVRNPSSDGAAVVKLNGVLAPLRTATVSAGRLAFAAPPVRLELRLADGDDAGARGDGQREADLVFRVGRDLEVGYRGYYGCPSR